MQKLLWVVNYDDPKEFLDAALEAKATGVAIRTDNDIAAAVTLFGKHGIGVFGGRWPSAHRDAALKEARKAASLFEKGLAGYFVDPEGEHGQPYDWDQNGLQALAQEFCATVVAAAKGRPFGVTSHYRAAAVFPHLPWRAFFEQASVLLPQSYWRVAGGVVGHGIPADNYKRGIEFWVAAGGVQGRIAPMAGELDRVTPSEIAQYATQARATPGIDQMHFYAWTKATSAAVLQAIAAS